MMAGERGRPQNDRGEHPVAVDARDRLARQGLAGASLYIGALGRSERELRLVQQKPPHAFSLARTRRSCGRRDRVEKRCVCGPKAEEERASECARLRRRRARDHRGDLPLGGLGRGVEPSAEIHGERVREDVFLPGLDAVED